MPDAYDYISLMCRLKAAQTRNKELESGEHYIKLKELHQKECRAYERKIQALLTEIADAHKETIRVRNYWFQVLEDMLLEFEAMQKKADQKLREMEKRALLAERQRDDALEKAKEFRLKFYETATQLEEEQGKNLKLHAQINRDYENSSIPSSKAIRRKKIANSREKTGRKPGGQPGLLWSSIFVTLMANKIGGLQFGIYRNCQISSRVFHTAVAALPLTKANRSDFE